MKNVMVIIDESNSSYDLLNWALKNHKDTIESSKVFIFATQPQNSFTPPTVLSSSVGFAQIFYPFSPSKSFLSAYFLVTFFKKIYFFKSWLFIYVCSYVCLQMQNS